MEPVYFLSQRLCLAWRNYMQLVYRYHQVYLSVGVLRTIADIMTGDYNQFYQNYAICVTWNKVLKFSGKTNYLLLDSIISVDLLRIYNIHPYPILYRYVPSYRLKTTFWHVHNTITDGATLIIYVYKYRNNIYNIHDTNDNNTIYLW